MIFGRPKNPEQWFRVLKRKGYECLYSKIFFDGLKWYLSKGLCKDLKDYRYFLVVLYLHTVQSKVGSETYRPLDKMYSDIEIEKWPKELLFLTCLGLNSRPITMTRVWEYWGVIQKYALNEEKLEKMVEQLWGWRETIYIFMCVTFKLEWRCIQDEYRASRKKFLV